LVVAAAWIPLRSGQPNVEVGLILVAVVTAVGVSGRRAAVIAAAVSAAASFTFFDTQPYDHFAISRQPDVVTAVSLVVVGIATGELAVRVARQRRSDLSVAGELSRVREAASLLAAGEELVVMIGAVAQKLRRQLRLQDCWFAAEPITEGTPTVARDGTIRPSSERSPIDTALPVWALGQVVGHFVLQPQPGATFDRERLQVAVTLADQVGAALAAQAPPPLPATPTPDPPKPNLRVIH
jgi:K+-sensing histidine kinase KdpD